MKSKLVKYPFNKKRYEWDTYELEKIYKNQELWEVWTPDETYTLNTYIEKAKLKDCSYLALIKKSDANFVEGVDYFISGGTITVATSLNTARYGVCVVDTRNSLMNNTDWSVIWTTKTEDFPLQCDYILNKDSYVGEGDIDLVWKQSVQSYPDIYYKTIYFEWDKVFNNIYTNRHTRFYGNSATRLPITIGNYLTSSNYNDYFRIVFNSGTNYIVNRTIISMDGVKFNNYFYNGFEGTTLADNVIKDGQGNYHYCFIHNGKFYRHLQHNVDKVLMGLCHTNDGWFLRRRHTPENPVVDDKQFITNIRSNKNGWYFGEHLNWNFTISDLSSGSFTEQKDDLFTPGPTPSTTVINWLNDGTLMKMADNNQAFKEVWDEFFQLTQSQIIYLTNHPDIRDAIQVNKYKFGFERLTQNWEGVAQYHHFWRFYYLEPGDYYYRNILIEVEFDLRNANDKWFEDDDYYDNQIDLKVYPFDWTSAEDDDGYVAHERINYIVNDPESAEYGRVFPNNEPWWPTPYHELNTLPYPSYQMMGWLRFNKGEIVNNISWELLIPNLQHIKENSVNALDQYSRSGVLLYPQQYTSCCYNPWKPDASYFAIEGQVSQGGTTYDCIMKLRETPLILEIPLTAESSPFEDEIIDYNNPIVNESNILLKNELYENKNTYSHEKYIDNVNGVYRIYKGLYDGEEDIPAIDTYIPALGRCYGDVNAKPTEWKKCKLNGNDVWVKVVWGTQEYNEYYIATDITENDLITNYTVLELNEPFEVYEGVPHRWLRPNANQNYISFEYDTTPLIELNGVAGWYHGRYYTYLSNRSHWTQDGIKLDRLLPNHMLGVVNYRQTINSSQSIDFTTVSSASIDVDCNLPNENMSSWLNQYVVYFVDYKNNNNWQRTGWFTIDDIEAIDPYSTRVSGHDEVYKLNKYVDSFISQYEYPHTLTEFYHALLAYCDIQYDTSQEDYVNGSYIINRNFTITKGTGIQIASFITQIAGAYIYANDGDVVMKSYDETESQINTSNYTDIQYSQYNVEDMGQIKIVVNDTVLAVSTNGNADKPYYIKDNPLITISTAETTAKPICDNIRAIIDDLPNYRSSTISCLTPIEANIGDIITVNTVSGTTFKTMIMDVEIGPRGITYICKGEKSYPIEADSSNGQIISLQSEISTIASGLEDTAETVLVHTSDISSINTAITTLNNTVGSHTNSIADLDERVEEIEESSVSQSYVDNHTWDASKIVSGILADGRMPSWATHIVPLTGGMNGIWLGDSSTSSSGTGVLIGLTASTFGIILWVNGVRVYTHIWDRQE